MVIYLTNDLFLSSELTKEFGQYLSQIKNNTVDKLAVLKKTNLNLY